MGSATQPRALVISSAVTSGYVGNNAVTFALQRLGFEVIAVPTVLLTTHTGHAGVSGRRLPADQVAELIDGLIGQGLLDNLDLVLSGYLGSPENTTAVAAAVRHAKSASPGCRYACDPVLGNRRAGTYVAPGIVAAIAEELAPLADVLTPNHYELELLSGGSSLDTALLALAGESRTVLVTSLEDPRVPSGEIGTLLYDGTCAPKDEAGGACAAAPARIAHRPRIDVPGHGAGDLTAALFAGLLALGRTAEDAWKLTLDTVWAVLAADPHSRAELPLIAAQDRIRSLAEDA